MYDRKLKNKNRHCERLTAKQSLQNQKIASAKSASQ
jgi:hypothetical protein